MVFMGLPILVLLVTATDDPQGLFGTQDVLTLPVGALLALQALGGLYLWLGPVIRQRPVALWLRLALSLLPVPLLGVMWGLAWHLATLGLLVVLVQAFYLARSPALEAAETLRPWRRDQADAPAALAPRFGLVWRLAAGVGVLVVLVSGHGIARTPLAWSAVRVYVGLAVLISLRYEIADLVLTGHRRLALALGLFLAFSLAVGLHPAGRPALLPLLGLRQAVAALALWHHYGGAGALWRRLTRNPAGLLCLSFALAIVVGALVLDLPAAASADGPAVGVVDALFTATSALCVTGLTVVDTGAAFSTFGELVILTLIQVGGLGVMTISIFVALLLGRDTGLESESALGAMLGEDRTRAVRRLVWFIVGTTVVTEALGGLVLAAGFWQEGMAPARGLYCGIFHAISAFCNAGFALFPDSFVSRDRQLLFPLVLSLLIALGGLGFSVLHGFGRCLRPHRRRGVPWPLHTRLVLAGSVLLWLGGMACFCITERHGVLAGRPWPEALTHAWFLSVTARTAGFNTVDMTALHPATDLILRGLMVIGAGPGSTAGGIKVTTAAVLVLIVLARLKGRAHGTVLGRRLDDLTALNAVSVATLALALVALASALLLLTQPIGPELTPAMLSFEVISAFGTVGLSTGATPHLNTFGKAVVIVLMFVGRVGPLTLLVSMRPRRRRPVQYPVANVMVG